MTDLQPGPELDALISEKVMDLSVVRPSEDPETWYIEVIEGNEQPVPKYSKFIAWAWEVVEQFNTFEIGKRGPSLSEIYCSLTRYEPEQFGVSSGTTVPHAICLAALKAVGYSNS